MPLSLLNAHESLWNLKLKLLGSQLVDTNYPGHLLCSISTLWNPMEPLYIPLYPYNLAKYSYSSENFTRATPMNAPLSFSSKQGSPLIDLTCHHHPRCSISFPWNPLEPLHINPYNSAKCTLIFIKMYLKLIRNLGWH